MTSANESDPFPLEEMLAFLGKLNLSTLLGPSPSPSDPSDPSDPSPSSSHCYEPPTLELISRASAQEALFLLYTTTSLISITGNSLILLVHLLTRRRQRRQAAKMRNYLSSLAVSDLLLALLSAPFTYSNLVLRHWIYPAWLCPLAQFAQLLSSLVTSLTLSVIALERYLVAFYTLSPACKWFTRHSGHLIVATWLAGSLYAYLPSRLIRTSPFLHGVTLYEQCSFLSETTAPSGGLTRFLVVNLLTFLLPLATISLTYGAIMRKLAKCDTFIVKYVSSGARDEDSWIRITLPIEVPDAQATPPILTIEQRSKTIKMLLIIILAYVICWAPVKVFQLLHFTGSIGACSELSFYALAYAYLVCHWLAMANCTVNPIIFSFMSKSFRNDFCRLCLLFGEKLSLIKGKETVASELSRIETIDC